MRTLLLILFGAGAVALVASPRLVRAPALATTRPLTARFAAGRVRAPVACVAAARTVVVTDMDETLISKKSTGYIITFLVKLRSLRIVLVPLLAAVLIPISKVSRTFAVRCMYWFAFRGVRVDKAKRIAEEVLAPKYVADLQDPAASAVLAADEAIIITASPDFMARPWLERYLGVKPSNVYGAVLEEKSSGRFTRFTGRTMQIPIGEAKAEILRNEPLCSAPGTTTVGYGDHPTDLQFMQVRPPPPLDNLTPLVSSPAAVAHSVPLLPGARIY